MAELKTQANDGDVDAFLDRVPDPQRRADAVAVRKLMADVSGQPGQMWGDSIVGFGQQHLRYSSGRELDWFVVGFSPRKQNMTIYLTEGFEAHQALLDRLGPHSLGKSCLYVKRLDDVDIDVLRELVGASVASAGHV
jgi:Domain of unknown function (DU1801)